MIKCVTDRQAANLVFGRGILFHLQSNPKTPVGRENLSLSGIIIISQTEATVRN